VNYYRQGVVILGVLFIGLGIALIVRTAQVGGGLGYLIGILFLGLGVGRIFLQRRR
jgi:hypothetical protein